MALVRNIYVDQGAQYELPFTINDSTGSPLNLLGARLVARMKRSYESTSFTELTVNITDANLGKVTLVIEPTTSLNVRYGRYVYDVIMVDEYEIPKRVLEGQIVINPAVTKITEPEPWV